ncbi:hypothetical protein [Microbacterium sp. TNHR37B]|uniref:hypothetical protein n=1 Tax=Microbacterium sp. TNHR37B TaxID=1775956 RepID=UPI0007B2C40C|nr:hypothetical protein [Microbacterium sp. TNHR37B]KZE91186.1 hypothetical protein AVP41_00721 [Microbacterium sp. TNHR37B]
MSWAGYTPLAPVCIDCGETVDVAGVEYSLDWRDDDERRRGHNAIAIQGHRRSAHPVEPVVGDLVTYSAPWRGHILESEVYRVEAISEHDHHAFARGMRGDDLAPLWGWSYCLVNPHRRDDRCFPFVGDPLRPITFRIVSAAPPVEVDLLDLLGWSP